MESGRGAASVSGARKNLNLIVFLSNRCNLQCHYCAVEVNKGKAWRLDDDKLRRGLTRYLDETQGRKSVALLGGEPFLNVPLIERFADFARAEAARRAEPIPVTVYTNGTLLTQEHLASLSRRGVRVWLSVDGRARSNDHHRTFRSGNRSVFAQIERRLEGVEAGQLRAHMILHSDTARDLVCNAEWFFRRGFPFLNFNPELWEGWSERRLKELEVSLRELARWYRARWESLGRPPFELPIIPLVLDHAPRADDPEPWWERCENLVYGADGRFHACERDAADDYSLSEGRIIGDPESGVDWGKKEALLESSRRILRARGAKKEWHHACPKGLVMLAAQRGWDPDRVLDSFQKVSGVFGDGIVRFVAELRDLPGFCDLYPGAQSVVPRRRAFPPACDLDDFLDSAATGAGAAAHGLGAAAITRFWEADTSDLSSLSRLWRRFEGRTKQRRRSAPSDPASRLLLKGLARVRSDGVPGRPDARAVADWDAAWAENPLCSWAPVLLGTAALQERKLDEALERFGFAVSLRPRWSWARLMRAWTYHLLGRQDEARQDLSSIPRSDRFSHWAEALRANVDGCAGSDEMLRRLSNAAKKRPMAWTVAWRGYARLRRGLLPTGVADLDRALKMDPAFDRAWVWRAEAAAAAGDHPLAERAASEAIALSPTMPTAFLVRARARFALGDARGGLADLEAMARLNRRYEWETNWFNVHYLHDERDWSALEDVAASALAAAPGVGVLSLILGHVQLAKRNYSDAERLIAQAEERGLSREWRPWAALWRAMIARRLDRPEDAAAHLRRVDGLAQAWGLTLRSALEFDRGRWEAARSLARSATEKDPRLSDAWHALAGASLALGDEATALGALERHSALEPMMAWSREWRGRLCARLGRWRQAEDALSQIPHPSPAATLLRQRARRYSFEAGVLPHGPDGDLEESLATEDFSWVFDIAPASNIAHNPDRNPPTMERLPKDHSVFLTRGRAALAAGDFAVALNLARWVVSEPIYAPWSEEGLIIEICALAALGRADEAAARREFLSRLYPASPWPWATAARLKFADADFAGARRELGLALRAAPRNAHLRVAAAAMLEREPSLRGVA